MVEFTPPINQRETEELIIIASDYGYEVWSEEAVRQAEEELRKREVTDEIRTDFINYVDRIAVEDENEILEERKVKSFTTYEKANYIVRWPRKIFVDWDLKKEGYTKKAKQRKILLLTGLGLYIVVFMIVQSIIRENEQARLDEINKILEKDSVYQSL